MNNKLEIISLTKRDLKKAVDLNTYWSDSYEAPFSKNKTIWMLDNNRADDDDVLATLAYENYRLVAFVGFIPDWVKTNSQDIKKIFWSQRWWIVDEYKTTILSAYTKNASLSAVNNQVFVKFFGVHTEGYYKKQPFTRFAKRDRYIILYNLNSDLLIYKNQNLKKFKLVLKFLDRVTFKTISFLNRVVSRSRVKLLSINDITLLDDHTWNFVKKHCDDDVVPKTLEYINWQISNDQYHNLEHDEPKPSYQCLLGSISSRIYNLNFSVKKNNKVIGFISANIKDDRFVVRYFLTNEANFNFCIDALMERFIKSKCKVIQTENSVLGECLKKRYVDIYYNTRTLFSLFHNDINENFESRTLNDQDGYFY